VFRVDGSDEVDAAWQKIGALREAGALQWADFFTVDEFLAEQYVPGPEYSVEAFSFGGRHVAVAVTEKATLDGVFVEVGHALPARVDAATEHAIVDTVAEFLTAIGVQHGPTHTEVRVGPDGPAVIETHNRVGGDRINELVAAAYGIDLDTYSIGWPLGLVEELTERPEPQRAAATRFLFGEPGTVTAVDGADEVRADAAVVALDVLVKPGDVVHPLRGNWDRLGQVVATGADTAAAIAACEQFIGKITVTTES
jgi:biotin carboxylase